MLIPAGQSLKEVLLSPNFLQISETQTFTVHSNERIEQKYGLYMGHFLQGGNFSCFEPFSLKKKKSYISRSLAVVTAAATLIMKTMMMMRMRRRTVKPIICLPPSRSAPSLATFVLPLLLPLHRISLS